MKSLAPEERLRIWSAPVEAGMRGGRPDLAMPHSNAHNTDAMKTLNRRQFVRQSVGTATALAVLGGSKAVAANDKVVVGGMGIGGGGTGAGGVFCARKGIWGSYFYGG